MSRGGGGIEAGTERKAKRDRETEIEGEWRGGKEQY